MNVLQVIRRDTQAWISQVWISFCEKTCLVVSWLFLMSATFTVSKTVRDNHEAAQSETALDEAAELPSASR